MKLGKNRMKRMIFMALAIILAGPVFLSSSDVVAAPLQLKLASSTINISTFYNGTTLDVHGLVPVGADVVLQVSGPREDVHLKEKGKVAGFLWMNKNDVLLENTPAVYMIYTSADPKGKFVSPELGIGYKALVKDIVINPESADKAFIFAEYVKLMEESGVYAINEGTVTYGATSAAGREFSATLTIPSKMAAGEYHVTAMSLQDGVVTGRVQEKLDLQLTGLPATISELAYGRPLLFGFMAVFIAVSAGLIIGVIFRGGGGAH